MKRILFVNGSPNHNGNTAALARKIPFLRSGPVACYAGSGELYDERLLLSVWPLLSRYAYQWVGSGEFRF